MYETRKAQKETMAWREHWRRTYHAKKLVLVVLCSVLFAGCAKREEIVKTFSQSEEDGICATYYERKDGT